MFSYTIVQLPFSAPQIVVRAGMYANVYIVVHQLQRQKCRNFPSTVFESNEHLFIGLRQQGC